MIVQPLTVIPTLLDAAMWLTLGLALAFGLALALDALIVCVTVAVLIERIIGPSLHLLARGVFGACVGLLFAILTLISCVEAWPPLQTPANAWLVWLIYTALVGAGLLTGLVWPSPIVRARERGEYEDATPLEGPRHGFF